MTGCFFKEKANGQQAHEWMFNIISPSGNTDWKHSQLHFSPRGWLVLATMWRNGNLICGQWDRELAQLVWKPVWWFLTKLNIKSPCGRVGHSTPRYMYPHRSSCMTAALLIRADQERQHQRLPRQTDGHGVDRLCRRHYPPTERNEDLFVPRG